MIDDARQARRAGRPPAPDPTDAIVNELLALTVCDPACGSGHFLVAAARRIAKRVAAVREGNPEPTLAVGPHALHEVIARCIYGVDLNPMAVELAKVSLWLEALEAGKALSFLDAHVKCGNGLIGTTPALLRDGIPNTAFKKVEGDDPKFTKALAKTNNHERHGHLRLDLGLMPTMDNIALATALRRISGTTPDTLSEVREQARGYSAWTASTTYQHVRHTADAWCAAFMWRKTGDAPPPITHNVFLAMQQGNASAVPSDTHEEIARLREQYKFFHWHIAFPNIFTVPEDSSSADPTTGWEGGFSCILGNPPWDKVDFEDKKYFSVVEPSIAAMSGAKRRIRIERWMAENPISSRQYLLERRRQKSTFLFAGSSGAFPLCSKGLSVKGVTMLQTDQLFAERFSSIVSPNGRVGCVVPTAIATGAGSQYLFSSLTRHGAIRLLYDFENRNKIFESVDSRQKFCLLSLVGRGLREPDSSFAFFLLDPADLGDTSRIFSLTPDEIKLMSPNTGNLPIFRTRRDADLTSAVYRKFPVLQNDQRRQEGWQIQFLPTMFHLTDDSDIFYGQEDLRNDGWRLEGNIFCREDQRMVPLYEAKMVDFFNHRAADVVKSETAINRQNQPSYLTDRELQDGRRAAIPLHWIAESGFIETRRNGRMVKVPAVEQRLTEVRWDREWLCGWCDVTSSTNERTAIPAFLPRVAVGHTLPLMFADASSLLVAALVAIQSSLVFDFVSRQKIGGSHMALMTWKQLPVPTPAMLSPHTTFIVPRLLELVYSAYDMAGLARDLGDTEPPFRWDGERRPQIRAELDAYFFHLYGIGRSNVDYILDTFQSDSGGGLKNNEIAKYGTYRTKDLVLAEYDRMAAAGVNLDTPLVDGKNYVSTLNPPPGHGPRHAKVSG